MALAWSPEQQVHPRDLRFFSQVALFPVIYVAEHSNHQFPSGINKALPLSP